MQSLSRRRVSVVCFTYIILHLGLDASARLFEVAPGVSLWYPSAGLALSLVALLGWRVVPLVLGAQLFSSFVIGQNSVVGLQFALPLGVTVVYAGAGGLIRHYFGPVPRPTKPLATILLLAVFLIAPAVAAGVGTFAVWSAGQLPAGAGWFTLANWWLGDFTGVITVVPLCIVHAAPRLFGEPAANRQPWTWRRLAEVIAEAGLLFGCVWMVYGFDAVPNYHIYDLCFVPLVLICLRHGLPGATLTTCLLTMSSLAALNFYGGTPPPITNILFFVISVSVVGLGLGWSVTRRTFLEKERARLLEILEATTDFIGTCDLDGHIRYLNSAYLTLKGRHWLDGFQAGHVRDLMPVWAAEKAIQEGAPIALQKGFWHGETAVLDHDGNEVPVSQVIIAHFDAQHRPVAFSTIARDLRDQKKAERARLESERNLLQVQKLESLGVLAGGIAHDFNNLLTVMLGNATLARLDLVANSPGEQAVHQIELAALRAAELCRQMLTYSGKGGLDTELVDLTSVVEETTHLLKISIAKKCTLEFALARELPPVDGDASQLSQIAMNLVMNASDACRENGGRIVVRTGEICADRAYLATMHLPLPAEPGVYVFLEVSDEGCGITSEVLRRVFEPFFTTKFTGHGLGLSAVLGIIRSHHGAVKIDSEPGRGTTFRVLLPAARGTAAAPITSDTTSKPWRGSGRVLVVDDEEPVREIAIRILTHFGFEPVAALDGRNAVEIFDRQKGSFRAVLMDLSMPVMDGREAARAIHRLDPTVPILLMSGYNHSLPDEDSADDPFAGFVQKPFDTARLRKVLRSILDEAPAPASPEGARG